MKKKPAKSGNQQVNRGQFKPGQSGNPSGRPQGSRHKTTLAVQALLDGEAEGLTRVCIEKALDGDMTALRLCMDRIAPALKERPVRLNLPDTSTSAGLTKASETVLRSVSQGKITPSEGSVLISLFKEKRLAIEASDFEERLAALEKQVKGR